MIVAALPVAGNKEARIDLELDVVRSFNFKAAPESGWQFSSNVVWPVGDSAAAERHFNSKAPDCSTRQRSWPEASTPMDAARRRGAIQAAASRAKLHGTSVAKVGSAPIFTIDSSAEPPFNWRPSNLARNSLFNGAVVCPGTLLTAF